MSEYQYYEFLAVDRALSEREMAELRALSSRARITPTSFVNEYNWGSFKGNEDAWMDRYFDAFLYVANWGSRVFKLRLPSQHLSLADARKYCARMSFSAREKNDNLVLTFVYEDEESDAAWIDGNGILSSLILVRAELARGDRRPLYLGWLLALQCNELDDDGREPPVPPGLGTLSASQKTLVELLQIDPDLLHIAAEASSPISTASPGRGDVMAWLATLAPAEKDAWLARFLAEDTLSVSVELHRSFQQGQDIGRASQKAPNLRTVAQLRRATDAYAEERRRIEEHHAAVEADRRQRKASRERAKYLDGLTGKENQLWDDVETLIATKQAKKYDAMVQILVDLRDLATRSGAGDFGYAFGDPHSTGSPLLRA